MNRILAREAAARRERLLAAIGQRLGSDPNANLRSELQELQMWSWLQASLPASRAAAIFWPALVGLLSLAVVGLAWEWPRGTTRVVLNTSIEELSSAQRQIGYGRILSRLATRRSASRKRSS
jgi:hypothetical protein